MDGSTRCGVYVRGSAIQPREGTAFRQVLRRGGPRGRPVGSVCPLKSRYGDTFWHASSTTIRRKRRWAGARGPSGWDAEGIWSRRLGHLSRSLVSWVRRKRLRKSGLLLSTLPASPPPVLVTTARPRKRARGPRSCCPEKDGPASASAPREFMVFRVPRCCAIVSDTLVRIETMSSFSP